MRSSGSSASTPTAGSAAAIALTFGRMHQGHITALEGAAETGTPQTGVSLAQSFWRGGPASKQLDKAAVRESATSPWRLLE
jgi:hypothetical protein